MDDNNETNNVGEHILSDDHFTLYLPDFRDATVNTAVAAENSVAYEDARNFLSNRNWITPDLLCHVVQFYPAEGDITPGSGIRNLDAFKAACSVLFCEGRIYALSQQLYQVTTLFLDKWGSKSVTLGKKIACYYHKPQKTKVVSGAEKKYNVQTSQKLLVQCPFSISYSPVNFVQCKEQTNCELSKAQCSTA